MYRGRKILGVRAAKDCFRQNSILRALLAELTALSLALSLVFKTISRYLVVVVTVGMVWVQRPPLPPIRSVPEARERWDW